MTASLGMKAIGYCRVSTLDQAREGVSLEVQEQRIRAYCEMAGLRLSSIVREEGVSGSVPLSERPCGRRLLAVLSGDHTNHVVALKLDRLFRDAADALNQTRAWDKDGIALHLVDMGGQALNTSSAMGRMFLTMTAAFAELEKNLISERTASALAHKKANGQHVGRAPYGFVLRDKRLIPVPDEWQVIVEVRRHREQGFTLRRIAQDLNSRGVQTQRGGKWSLEVVRHLVSSPIYKEAS